MEEWLTDLTDLLALCGEKAVDYKDCEGEVSLDFSGRGV